MTGETVLLSMAAAFIAFTVSETAIFKPLREVFANFPRLGEMVHCGYCLGFWASCALVAVCRPSLFEVWRPLDLLLTAFVMAWLAAFQWGVFSWLMIKLGK